MNTTARTEENTSNTAAHRAVQAAFCAEYRPKVEAAAREMVPAPHVEEATQAGLIGVLLALERRDSKSDEPFERVALEAAKTEIRTWHDAGTYYRKPALPTIDLRYESVACTPQCLAVVRRLMPKDADSRQRRQVNDVVMLALVAAGEAYAHGKKGRKFWSYARPRVATAIRAWIVEGMPITTTLDAVKAELKAFDDALADAHASYMKSTTVAERRQHVAQGLVCTPSCSRLIRELLPTGYDWKVWRQAEEVTRLAVVAALVTRVHRQGQRFWPHAKPYVTRAIKAWIADGTLITLEWLN